MSKKHICMHKHKDYIYRYISAPPGTVPNLILGKFLAVPCPKHTQSQTKPLAAGFLGSAQEAKTTTVVLSPAASLSSRQICVSVSLVDFLGFPKKMDNTSHLKQGNCKTQT